MNIRSLSRLHPVPFFLYFLSVLLLSVFSSDPVSGLLSLFSGILVFGRFLGLRRLKKNLGLYAAVFFLFAFLNPILVHRGDTPFLFINGTPLTVEALVFGVTTGFTALSALIWLAVFSEFLSSDGLLYLAGRTFPRTAITLSAILRFIPLLIRRSEAVTSAMVSIGEGNGLKGKLEIYSGVVTYALETSLDTADSMRARGYGADISPCTRTLFSQYRFRNRDWVYLTATLVTLISLLLIRGFGGAAFQFYPVLEMQENSLRIPCAIVTAVFFLLPVLFRRPDSLEV